jgi:hypothetical protein
MSDTALPVIFTYGTHAARLLFTPSPAAGVNQLYIWYESDTNEEYHYTTAWHGPFTSGSGGTFVDDETPGGTIDGTNTAFTLANAPSPASSLNLFLNGLRLTAGGVDYTLAGTAITMVSAPNPGDVFVANYRM